ncbi:MAG: EutN/CcmL family microcompartment protein [Planctomycetota bacterium]|nr:EutN/CcmL family microcompartment protein [Planctomycetota bacterium]
MARVVGSIWATRKTERMEALPMQLIETIDATSLNVLSSPFAAVNTVGACEGDIVFYVEAYEACLPLPDELVPVDASIIGIVEQLGDKVF